MEKMPVQRTIAYRHKERQCKHVFVNSVRFGMVLSRNKSATEEIFHKFLGG
jgi:hypothetical protein